MFNQSRKIQNSTFRYLLSLIKKWKFFILLLLIVIFARSLVFEFFFVPTGSMRPTINPGDFIFATKYDYGYSTYSAWPFRLPEKTFSSRIFTKPPARGDIVVIRRKNEPRLIKRLVGLPGDKIQFINGKMFINNVAIKKEFLEPLISQNKNLRFAYRETLDKNSYTLYEEEVRPQQHLNSRTYFVPTKCYFLLGDNRDNSADSRAALGCVPEKFLIAKAKFVIAATNNSFDPRNWSFKRFFTNLHP